MSYLVLARKYRPQSFDQVVKQDHVAQTLTHAIAAGRVAHGILFSGPRGTGKTTVARILAKAMNCESGPTPVPCNSCRSCRDITLGRAVDVFEIDGASNNSVDQIRDLRENVKYMPAHSRYKIYIIDEVHMLSTAAFNALLKTLEEPPAHVLFVFATTEPHKIPITILSRCQRHDFRLIDVESICRHMQTVCEAEGVDIGAESIALLAREGGGSMRDALSLLDQVMSSFSGAIAHQQVLDLLGVVDRKIIYDLSTAVIQGDIPGVLDIVDEIYGSGHDLKKLYADVVEHFRNLLVVKMGKKVGKLVDIPSHEIDLMFDQVKSVSETYLSQIFELLFKEGAVIGQSLNPKLAIEMIFIKLLQIKPALPIEELIEKLDHLRKKMTPDQENGDDSEPESGPIDLGKNTQTYPNEATGTAECIASYTPAPFDGDEGTQMLWEKLFLIFSEKHPSLAANLKNSRLKDISDDCLEIEVGDNGFNYNMVRREKNLGIIRKVCSDVLGRKMKIEVTAASDLNAQNQEKKNRADQLRNEALSHPLVVDTLDVFSGKVIDVKIL